MAYIIVKTDGTVLTTITDGTINTTSTSLGLPGRNYSNYGQVFDTNFVHLLENFADSSMPSDPIKGQLWYNTSTQALYICPSDGETNINNWLQVLAAAGTTVSFINLTLSGNLYANNASIANNLTSNSIVTDTLLVNLQSNLLGTSNIVNVVTSNITADTSTGNLNGNWAVSGNIEPMGILTDNFYYANGDPINFNVAAGNTHEVQFNTSGNYDASANFTFNPLTNNLTITGNTISTNFVGDGTGLSVVPAANLTGTINPTVQTNITQLGTLSTIDITGNANIGNAVVTGDVSATTLTGLLTSSSQPNITSTGILTSLQSTGVVNFTNASNVTLGPVSNVRITGGTNGYVLSTNGSGTLTWTNPATLAVTPAGSNTQIQYNNNGVLSASPDLFFDFANSNLNVNGNIIAKNSDLGNVAVANYFSGNASQLFSINASNISGAVASAAVAVTVTSSIQPAITTLGTLSNLVVGGNSTLGNRAVANYFVGNGSQLYSINGANVSIVANSTYATTAGTAVSVPGANITGTVANATYADTAGSVATAGTVTNGAQPNITSLGSLSGLTVNGVSTYSGQLNVPLVGIKFANLSYPSGTQNAYINYSTYSGAFGFVKGTKLTIGIDSTNLNDFVTLEAPAGARINGYPIYTDQNSTVVSGMTQAYNYTNQVGSFNDSANYFDIFPPSGYTMYNLYAFIPSIAYIYYAGGVDGNDALRCVQSNLSDRIRVYVQNTEQRYYPSANWLAIWRK